MSKKNNTIKKFYKINEDIKYSNVRLVSDNIVNVFHSLQDTLNNAYHQGLDLILINEKADPPVCKIEDYSKFLYKLKK